MLPESRHAEPGHAELRLAKPLCEIWGVLNVTPDSFSDGGRFDRLPDAIEHARLSVEQGADVIDVGGESSRPAGATYGRGAAEVPTQVEAQRVVPVIKALVGQLGLARVSVDTTKPDVARRALAAGATIVNDVSCGACRELLRVAAEAKAELVLMHTRGRGKIGGHNAVYGDVVQEVVQELLEAVERAEREGVRRDRIWIDPGIGFAKTWRQSLRLLANLEPLVATGQRVLVGTSRKSFIAESAPGPDGSMPPPLRREGGTAATVSAAVLSGAHAVRVHQVDMMRQAALVAGQLKALRKVAAC